MSAPAVKAERLSLPIRRRVRARIAHQLAIRTGPPKLIARRSAAPSRGREADIGIPRALSAQPQKACNHQYHDDYANDVKHFDPPTRAVTLPASSDHIGIPGVGGRLGNYPHPAAWPSLFLRFSVVLRRLAPAASSDARVRAIEVG